MRNSCCALYSGEVKQTMIESGIGFSIFFCTPNIYPVKEYLIHKQENIRFAQKHTIAFIAWEFDTDNWFEGTKDMKNKPKKGFVVRCVLTCNTNV